MRRWDWVFLSGWTLIGFYLVGSWMLLASGFLLLEDAF
jgi:hypothetical protein